MRRALLAAVAPVHGARLAASSAAVAAPQPVAASGTRYGTLAGTITSLSLDGPRERQDGSQFWIYKYVVNDESGADVFASQFVETADADPVATVGQCARLRVKRVDEYTNVLGLESAAAHSAGGELADVVASKDLKGVVEKVEREGPLRSYYGGREYWNDRYTVRTAGGVVCAPMFTDGGSFAALEGDHVEAVLQEENGHTRFTRLSLQADAGTTVRGTVEIVKKVQMRRPNGSRYVLECYQFATDGGRARQATRFAAPGSRALARVGQQVVAEVSQNGPYTNLVSITPVKSATRRQSAPSSPSSPSSPRRARGRPKSGPPGASE